MQVAVQLEEHLRVNAAVADEFRHRVLVDAHTAELRVRIRVVQRDDTDRSDGVTVSECDGHVGVTREVVGDQSWH